MAFDLNSGWFLGHSEATAMMLTLIQRVKKACMCPLGETMVDHEMHREALCAVWCPPSSHLRAAMLPLPPSAQLLSGQGDGLTFCILVMRHRTVA